MTSRTARAVRRVGIAASVYAVVGFGLYRARTTSEATVWDSDLLVFYGPAVAAFVLLTAIAWRALDSRRSRPVRAALSIGIGLATTVLAFLAYALVAFNRYGT